MESYFRFISPFIELSTEARSAMEAVLQGEQLKKGHQLLRPNTICNHIYFIEKGLTRTFYLKDGKDVTDWISTENSISCSIVSFITRMPDRRGIELLEDSVLWSFEYHALENLYRKFHEIEKLGRLLVSMGLVQVQKRFDDLHFASATERYEQLITNHPDILQRVPLGMVASYLGITQETLSRIRSQFSR